ncbi:hypothetical protein KUCAC02_037943, partial [Chaenocephalus aceratus]
EPCLCSAGFSPSTAHLSRPPSCRFSGRISGSSSGMDSLSSPVLLLSFLALSFSSPALADRKF